jgi:dipeptidyl aminopeptidase/acylaminoacyl peptidase
MFSKRLALVCGLVICLVLAVAPWAQPQQGPAKPPSDSVRQGLQDLAESLQFAQESLQRTADDLLIFRRLDDLAQVDKVRYTGPPPRIIKNPTAQGAGNPVVLTAYTFLPKKQRPGTKIPLVILVHGGIHGNLDSTYIPTLRELLAQGYAVLAPEYRGSSGYGKEFWQLIDYGGLEVEDVFAGRNWMLDNHDNIDAERVGIIGWSHGGLIALMNLFAHPREYQVGYAGVPVCDLIARMGYKGQAYRDLFSAPYHIGKTAEEDVNEYRRRSPAWNAEKLKTPLLIHTTTNDEDVNVLEVEHLIRALKAADRKFEHKIYKDAPGGHEFNRLDTQLARQSRAEVYRFLARYLTPAHPVK